jgi:hypothetical protein
MGLLGWELIREQVREQEEGSFQLSSTLLNKFLIRMCHGPQGGLREEAGSQRGMRYSTGDIGHSN